jgi:hypothetical protein
VNPFWLYFCWSSGCLWCHVVVFQIKKWFRLRPGCRPSLEVPHTQHLRGMAPCKPMNMIFLSWHQKGEGHPASIQNTYRNTSPLPLLRNYRGPRCGNQMLELIVVRESLLPQKFSYANVKTNCCRRTCQSRYADVETKCCQRNSDMPVLKPIVRDPPIPIHRC